MVHGDDTVEMVVRAEAEDDELETHVLGDDADEDDWLLYVIKRIEAADLLRLLDDVNIFVETIRYIASH